MDEQYAEFYVAGSVDLAMKAKESINANLSGKGWRITHVTSLNAGMLLIVYARKIVVESRDSRAFNP
jgi:hypothetical protein